MSTANVLTHRHMKYNSERFLKSLEKSQKKIYNNIVEFVLQKKGYTKCQNVLITVLLAATQAAVHLKRRI